MRPFPFFNRRKTMQAKLKAAGMILAVFAICAAVQRNVFAIPVVGDYLPK